MNKLKKVYIILSLISIMILMLIFVSKYEDKYEKALEVSLVLPDNNVLLPWKDENIWYYFLPSYVELNDIILAIDDKNGVLINGTPFFNGDYLSGIEMNKEYLFESNAYDSYTVVFKKSENVSTVFVSTSTGSMNSVLKNKKNKELAKITIVDSDGNIDIASNDSRIRGRGNSTWQNKKKPFSIIFSESLSILGMAESSEWALLANAYDYSSIRNAIVYDTARNIGLSYTPEYRFVDLYLNGLYNGLYMICQPVDHITENDNSITDGLYLFSAELPDRAKNMNFLLYAENGEAFVDVCYPKKLSNNDKEISKEIITKLDTAISKGDENIGEVIDLDSYVKKYLIDEIFANYDAGLASSYFYYYSNSSDSKVYAGPIWDYDMSIGNLHSYVGTTRNPEILIAKQQYRTASQRLLWYSELYSNPVFFSRMVNTFEKELIPQLELLIDKDIRNLANEIKQAKMIDDLRWNKDSSEEYDYIIDYLSRRVEFLKSIWLENEEFIEVVYYTPGKDSNYMRLYVPKGTAIADDQEYMKLFSFSDKWCIENSNEVYDFCIAVNEPITLVNSSTDGHDFIKTILDNASKEVKLFFIIASIILLLLSLLFMYLYMNLRRGVK